MNFVPTMCLQTLKYNRVAHGDYVTVRRRKYNNLSIRMEMRHSIRGNFPLSYLKSPKMLSHTLGNTSTTEYNGV